MVPTVSGGRVGLVTTLLDELHVTDEFDRLVGPHLPCARQPVPTADRHRSAPAPQLVALRPVSHGQAHRARGAVRSKQNSTPTAATAHGDAVVRPGRRSQGHARTERSLAMNAVVLSSGLATRPPRARTRLRLPLAARQRRARGRCARRGAQHPTERGGRPRRR